MTQPRALFLADVLDDTGNSVNDAAAAELRRLHAEREMLLKALKYVYKELRKYGRQHWSEAVRASAAIAKAEEKA